MAQVSYGTITITDTNDIESIIVEYARNQSTSEAPASGWSTTRPAWAQGYYIWQRTRIHKSGTQDSADTFGTAVCLTGSTGQTGQTGKGITGIETLYATNNSATTAPTSGWQSQPPTYNSSKPKYWVKVTTTYNSGNPDVVTYLDNGITDAMATAAAANSTANTANQTANAANQTATNAKNKADTVEGNLNNYITSNNNALNALQTKTKYFWTNLVAHTNGSGGWTKPNYPVGTYAASGISGTTFDEENSSTYGYNTLYANGIKLRYNAINLGELTGSSLIFYKPSTTSQGGKAMELSGSALKFYNPTNSSISMMDLTSSGLTFKTAAGATIGTFGSDASGGLLDLSGRLNIKGGGRIGQDSDNYWEFGDNKSYNDEDSAYLMGKGTASIQLGETGHWRLDRNRIHTGWYQLSDSTAGTIHFDTGADNGTTYYWDYGLHYPNKSGNGNNKFLYVRRSSSSTSTSLSTIKGRIDDDSWWVYKFYIDGEGNIHAGDIYSHDVLISGTSAPYLLKSGGTITGNLEVNGTLTKGGKTVTYLTSTPINGQILVADGTSGGIKTSGYTIATSVPSNALFTDKNVQTESATNGTTFYLAGPTTVSTNTGTLKTSGDAKITINSSGKATITATTFSGSLSGTASHATADSDGNTIKTTYLKLSGGNVTGPVSFGDFVSIDDLTAGNLVVNGTGRFTNGLYGDLIGNADTATTATTATKVGKDLKIQLNGGTTEDTNQFTFNGSVAKTVNITKSSVGLGNVENKSSATIRGELTSSNVTAALGFTPYNATNPNGYTTNTGTVTSVKVQGSNGLTGSGTVTTSGTITLSHDDTSSQASSSNSGRTYIQSVTLDGYGHVTGLSTATETVTNTHNTAYLYAGTSSGTANAATTNGNTYLILMDGGSATTRRKISGSGTVSVASNASGDITITGSAHPVAFNGVSFANGIITFTKTDGNSTTIQTDNFVITQAAGATALVGTDTDHTPLNVNGPVKFTNGVPVTMRPSSASGKFLKDDGTWDTPEGTYSLPLAANGTRGGVQIGYTQSGKNYPVQLSSEKMYVNVPWTDTTYSAGTGLSLSGTTFSNSGVRSISSGTGNGSISVNTNGTAANVYVKGIEDGYINIHPENTPIIIPFMHNDIAHLLKRGGSATITYDGVVQNHDLTNCFDGSSSYWSIANVSVSTIIIELSLHKTFSYGNTAYVDFGNVGWRAKAVKIEAMNSTYSNDTWTTKLNTTTNEAGHITANVAHQPSGASNTGGGFNKIRFTFSDFNSKNGSNINFRIAQLGIYNYGSSGLRETYMSRGSDDPIFRSITPNTNNTYSLGSSSNKWNTVYATTFNGNALTATKATQDGSGNIITSTYVKKVGDTMSGDLSLQGSTNDSPDIVWNYSDGTEKMLSVSAIIGMKK